MYYIYKSKDKITLEVMKIEEELVLFEEFDEKELIEDDSNIVIHGDVMIEIHNHGDDNVTPQRSIKQLRNTVKPMWKKAIKARDENYCQCCGEKFTEHLEVHHIMPLSKYGNLKSDKGNGISLCQKCHKKYHDMYAGSENAVTFAKFLRDFGERIYR